MVDRRRRHQRPPLSDDADNTADLNVPLSNSADLFNLQACEPFKASPNSNVFNVPKGATAVLDKFYDHPA
jgi:hypothetical protein